MSAPVECCGNKSWNADKPESMVWAELERYLSNRDLIKRELEKQRNDANSLDIFKAERGRTER